MHIPFLKSQDAMCHDVLQGLAGRPKTIPSKYFYDAAGCQLFDNICELPEYYLTRTELSIMRDHVGQMAAKVGAGAVLLEYGSGSSLKTRLLLDALNRPRAYLPLDIASDHLQEAADALRRQHEGLEVIPVAADFTKRFHLPENCPDGPRSIYFPGSTIGNLAPTAAVGLLRQTTQIGARGMLLGIDLVKDVGVLEAAYNDRQGATAAFNLNLLARLNRELGADFDLDKFTHRAVFNHRHQRMEMHLVSEGSQQVEIGEQRIEFQDQETIRTELSHKYELQGLGRMAEQAGLKIDAHWTDPRQWFAVVWLTPA